MILKSQHTLATLSYFISSIKVKLYYRRSCSKVIMSGVNGNVIMSGCGDDHSDDERREAARDNTKSV
jgi:hypothetical protein